MSRARSSRTVAPGATTAPPSTVWLQPKLSIGAPGDRAEPDADFYARSTFAPPPAKPEPQP